MFVFQLAFFHFYTDVRAWTLVACDIYSSTEKKSVSSCRSVRSSRGNV